MTSGRPPVPLSKPVAPVCIVSISDRAGDVRLPNLDASVPSPLANSRKRPELAFVWAIISACRIEAIATLWEATLL